MAEPDLLSVEWVSTSTLFCSPANPRRNEVAIPHVAASIQRFGWRQPIVAKPSGEVLAGNTRLKAAQQLGHDQMPVVWFDGSELEATAYAIADNRTAEFAEWDSARLAEQVLDDPERPSRRLGAVDQEQPLEAADQSAVPGQGRGGR